MDLALYLRILWRFRIVTAVGLCVAAAAAFYSYADVRFDGYKPSISLEGETAWKSEAVLLVTQPGFPWGSAFNSEGHVRFADTNRFREFAMLYAKLAESDLVQRQLVLDGDATVNASTILADDFTTVLPMVSITATTTSPERAEELARTASRALQDYLAAEQEANEVPPSRRIELPLVRQPTARALTESPSPIRPAFLFLLIAMATVGFAFVLENLRPRVRPALVVAPPPEREQLAVRRSRS